MSLLRLSAFLSVVLAALFLTPHAGAASPGGFQRVKTADTGATQAVFLAIAAPSPSDAWLVGDTLPTISQQQALAEHWDGTAWSVATLPLPAPATKSVFEHVIASGPTDVWVDGRYVNPPPRPRWHPFVDHWDGTSWTLDPLPLPAGWQSVQLLATTGPDDLWMGAGACTDPGRVLHWNGGGWKVRWRTQECQADVGATVQTSPGQLWIGGSEPVTHTDNPVLAPFATCLGKGCPSSLGSFSDEGSAAFTAADGTAEDAWMVGYQEAVDEAGDPSKPVEPYAYQWVGGVPTNQSPPPTYSASHVLHAVAVLPGGDVWAGGYRAVGLDDRALLMSHTTAGWTAFNVSTPGPHNETTYGIVRQIVHVPGTASEMWAIGAAGFNGGFPNTPFLLFHPDGGSVGTPPPMGHR